MKTKIHPAYFENLKITCACGNIILAGSTKKELKTELCSACHPFYTGKQKLVDTAGRVDKFMAKVKKTAELKEKKAAKKEMIAQEKAEAWAEAGDKKAPKAPAVKKTAKAAKTIKTAAPKKAKAPASKTAKKK